MTLTDTDPCPYCGSTSGVQPITGTSPKVQAWTCTACGTEWAISVVNPRLYLDQLATGVVVRQLTTLAQEAPGLSNQQLRTRLLALAGSLR